uniref:Aspergillus nuclease S(1) n=1 Tax=Alexandrium catenella TaxID=2925 RepID=A0A7S1PLT7_ALECA
MVKAVVLWLAAWLHVAAAWDKDGHEAIGMTTMSALEIASVTQVKRLMHGRDAVDVAAWAHKVNKKYPWTVELHYQRQPAGRCGSKDEEKKPADLTSCPDNRCLVKGLKHFYGRLVGKPLVEINWPAGMKLTDADAVKFLINLMGDLHQPLHFGRDTDNLGRNITVLFRNKKMSLYDMWDHEIAATVMKDSPGFWWGGWTHVQRTRVEYEKDGLQWKKDGVKMIETWADETSKYLCESVYRNPLTSRSILDELEDGVFRVDENLYEVWKREMLIKMLVAGARTAIVLNSILQAREAESLQGGTSVSEIEGEDDDEKKAATSGRKADAHHSVMGARQGPIAALMNAGIFLVVLIIFLQVMRMWLGKDAINQAQREKRSDGGKAI